MSRLVNVFVVGLLCGAVIVGALTVHDRAAPARAAGQWQSKYFGDKYILNGGSVKTDPKRYIDDFIMTLPSDCDIVFQPAADRIVYYRCP